MICGVRRLKLYTFVGVTLGLGALVSGSGAGWAVAAAVLGPAVCVLLARFLSGAFAGALTPSPCEEPAGRAGQMSGIEFEDYVATAARGSRLPVIMTPASGDWGVDLIVGHRPNRLAIQCKRVSRPVGPGAVQEVVAGAPMQDCSRTMVVTNHEFTPAARRLAELHDCELVSGSQLPQLRSLIRRAATDPVS